MHNKLKYTIETLRLHKLLRKICPISVVLIATAVVSKFRGHFLLFYSKDMCI